MLTPKTPKTNDFAHFFMFGSKKVNFLFTLAHMNFSESTMYQLSNEKDFRKYTLKLDPTKMKHKTQSLLETCCILFSYFNA